jgi:hypothetical protein
MDPPRGGASTSSELEEHSSGRVSRSAMLWPNSALFFYIKFQTYGEPPWLPFLALPHPWSPEPSRCPGERSSSSVMTMMMTKERSFVAKSRWMSIE